MNFPSVRHWSTRGMRTLGAVVLMAAASPGAEEARDANEVAIAGMIAALDDEHYAVREQARKDLLKIGPPAVPSLLKATRSDSPERRIRAAKLVATIRFQTISVEFEAMGKKPDDELDVEHTMWVIALLLDPDLEEKSVTESLDRMAAAVRKELGPKADPKSMPPAEVMAALTGVLKEEIGLQGDEITYVNPENSSIHRVIARKKGLPILLSEIAVAVARRLDLPVVGLPIPGRYMIKYDGARAPIGEDRSDIIVNPYEGWRVTTPAELARTVLGFDPRTDLLASPPRATISRMLRNMHSHALLQRKAELAGSILHCLELLVPDGELLLQ